MDGGSDRADPTALLCEARTVIVVALPYPGGAGLVTLRRERSRPLTGTVASYALGRDYHEVMKERLWDLAGQTAELAKRPLVARSCVDSAPLLEREAARRAGVGFVAKSTMNIVPGLGSFVLLGELLVDVDIEESTSVDPGCGRCTACLNACPTGAFDAAYQLDARRCISYLTIEHHGVIPRHLRGPIGTRIFGCDICQDVCPYNAGAGPEGLIPEVRPRGELIAADLVEWLELGSAAYRKLVKHSALGRAPRRVLKRNAAVALGNTKHPDAIAPLSRALSNDSSELVRGHAAWALGELFSQRPEEIRKLLIRTGQDDSDDWVREEAELALADNT
jgi:epoxyqueuosine reductase